jgi:hypothetical protein
MSITGHRTDSIRVMALWIGATLRLIKRGEEFTLDYR